MGTCAVFETVGDARLGDHLLAGLTLLLPVFMPLPEGGFVAIGEALAAARGADPADVWATSMVVECGMSTGDCALQLVSSGHRVNEIAPEAPPSSVTLAEDLREVWAVTRDRLSQRLEAAKYDSLEPSLLFWLAWRLGWECGSTLRALHGADISWGTYPDAMGIHCNAHVNNLVVKPPGVGRATTFLAALDFDMAFTRESFLLEVAASHAGVGLDSFEGVLEFEATMGMQTVLAGSDFTSTG